MQAVKQHLTVWIKVTGTQMYSPVSKYKLQSPHKSFNMESPVDLSSASCNLRCCGGRHCTGVCSI